MKKIILLVLSLFITTHAYAYDNPTSTSHRGVEFIKKHEGTHLIDGDHCAYYDAADVRTIGYGHTGAFTKYECITDAAATKALARDLANAERAVNELVDSPLFQNEYDALVSFVFNVGRGNFAKSTLLKRLNDYSYASAGVEFHKWVNAGGKYNTGLAKRRAAERKLFGGHYE